METEHDESQKIVFSKDGNAYTMDALVRKLKGDISALGGDPGTDEDSAIAALAGFDEAENVTGLMNEEEVNDFVDSFCEAWADVV